MITRSIFQRFLFSLSILTLLFLGACQDDPITPDPGSSSAVDGIIHDENGLIVPYATVEALSVTEAILAADTTDESGAFSLAALPENLQGISIRVRQSGFKPFLTPIATIVENAGARSGVILAMLHEDSCCARLVLQVNKSDGTGAVAGAEVKLRRGDRLVTVTRTNEEGVATFKNICEGEFNVRIAKSGYTVVERGDIRIEQCDTVRLELALQGNGEGDRDSCCYGVLKISAIDSASGDDISGASVKITTPSGEIRTGKTENGPAIFRELCAGTYAVRIAKEGDRPYRVVEFSVTMACNDTQSVSRTMAPLPPRETDTCCGGSVAIVVKDSTTGAIVSGATIQIKRDGAVVRTATSGANGNVFNELCRGAFSVRISRDGYKVIEFEFELGCNSSREFVKKMLALDNGGDRCCQGVAELALRDSTTNEVIKNATVKLWRGSTLVKTLTTSDNGGVRFASLCEGEYQFTLIREGYKSREVNFSMGCSDTIARNLRLLRNPASDTCCNASLKLKVKDSTIAEGGWLSGVRVVISRENQHIATGETNGDGWYLREALCGRSTYTVTFSKDGFRSKSVSFRYDECKALQETIRLVPE